MPSQFDEYAEAAGLDRKDFPSDHHPLLENDNEVRELKDLIDARRNQANVDGHVIENEGDRDNSLDIEDALTIGGKSRQRSRVENIDTLAGFDADARTETKPDDEDDASYMTRADFESSMLETDPDPNTGMDADEYAADEMNIDRSVDITGTATGLDRGMASHLPLDTGAQGFQILEPEDVGDPRAQELPAYGPSDEALEDEFDPDALTIPTAPVNSNSADERLDATRRLQ